MSFRIGLAGCGAVSRIYYADALAAIAESDPAIEIAALMDPDPGAVAQAGQWFGDARQYNSWNAFTESRPDFVVLASPPAVHARQAEDLIARNIPILCEKPLAASYREARSLVEVAERRNVMLAVGMIRRFLPAAEAIRGLVRDRTLGELKRLTWLEGNRFRWPVASTDYFDPRFAGGGVLTDIGVHVLDLLTWWLGDLEIDSYEDDALGGIETNCLAALRTTGGSPVVVRLTRDDDPPVCCRIEFEDGVVTWRHNDPNVVEILRNNDTTEMFARPGGEKCFEEAFADQVRDAIDAARSGGAPHVEPRSSLPALALIESCYARRALMPMPWLGPNERPVRRERAARVSR